MIAYKNFFIDYIKTDFTCPCCGKQNDDINLKYLDRCNKNKSWRTRIKCECGRFFYLGIDYRGVPYTYRK